MRRGVPEENITRGVWPSSAREGEFEEEVIGGVGEER